MSDSSIWGTLTRADAGVDITLRHVYRTSVADLWSAVTEPDRLARWLGRVTGDLHEQGSYTLVFEEDDDSQRASGVVLRCDAPRELVVTWAFPGEPDAGTVRVGLEAVDGGTELDLHPSRAGRPARRRLRRGLADPPRGAREPRRRPRRRPAPLGRRPVRPPAHHVHRPRGQALTTQPAGPGGPWASPVAGLRALWTGPAQLSVLANQCSAYRPRLKAGTSPNPSRA